MLNVVALLLILTAVFSYLNHRYTKLPTTIGVMAIALLLTLALAALSRMGFPALHAYQKSLLHSIDFTAVLMQGMLSFFLFAGALHVDVRELKKQLWQIGALATFGTLASALLVGFGSHALLALAGIELPLIYCLLFGALISPTDPIAVLGILKSARVPRSLQAVMAGESLFNDGVAIVLFVTLLDIADPSRTVTAGGALALFTREAVGGIAFGWVAGHIAYYMVKNVEDHQIEILITLATVVGGYALAVDLGVSGPIAMAVIGLVIGGKGRDLAMTQHTRERLDMFWELVDEILNLMLFLLLGLEVAVIAFPAGWPAAAATVIGITLAARAITVGIPVAALRGWFQLPRGSARVLTWGGLRGGVSVALALSLSAGRETDIVVMLTYSVVLFSIFAQGLSIGWVARAACGPRP